MKRACLVFLAVVMMILLSACDSIDNRDAGYYVIESITLHGLTIEGAWLTLSGADESYTWLKQDGTAECVFVSVFDDPTVAIGKWNNGTIKFPGDGPTLHAEYTISGSKLTMSITNQGVVGTLVFVRSNEPN